MQRRKDLALLVYLAVTAKPHARDTLATMLWPDQSQSEARANLRKVLSRLKNLLGEKSLSVEKDQVGINPAIPLWLDAAQLHSSLQQSRSHGHMPQTERRSLCDHCQTLLEETIKYHRGNFLEGFSVPDSSTFEEWQFFQNESLRASLGEALQLLIQQYIHSKNYNLAIESGRKWLALDSLHEPAHRQLMLAYALNGQRSAAIRQFEECSRLLNEELGFEPEPETLELHDAIRRKTFEKTAGIQIGTKHELKREPATSKSKGRNDNLPIHPTAFIGRAKELDEIQRLIREPGCRLVTLLGPGGSGKTRLAAQTGHLLANNDVFKDGVWFIQLAPLTAQNSIIPAIVRELNLPAPTKQGDQKRQLFDQIQNRQMLLILDNFEHLLDEECMGFMAEWINAAPGTKFLITSRERLNIQGEHLFPVEGLDTPPGEALLSTLQAEPEQMTFGAIQLFRQSARRVQPSFEITRENFRAISRICRSVQGMPLAIELAASWTEILPVEEIRAEIKQNLDFLQSELHDLPDRQRSLRTVFDSSWAKLSKSTRPTVKALSIFRSGFTRESAQVVAGASVKTLLELTNKSWIQPLADGRYQIHELLRQFAYKHLEEERVTFEQVRSQYCEYYASVSLSAWEAMKGLDQKRAFSIAESEYENIRTAWAWLTSDGKLEVAIHNMLPILFHYSESRGKGLELVGMLNGALEALGRLNKVPSGLKFEIILRTAQGAFHYDGFPLRFALYDGIFPIDMETTRQAWSLARKSVKLHELGFWGILLCFNHGRLANLEEAIMELKRMIPHLQRTDQTWELASAYLHLARLLILSREKRHIEGQALAEYLSRSLAIFQSLGDRINAGHALSQWGELNFHQQDLESAIQHWKAAHSSLLEAGEWSSATEILWQIGDACLQLGLFQKAFDCFEEISRVYFERGMKQQAISALSKQSYEMVRYGDLAEALKKRQQCIDIIQETGPEYQVAWNYWEMGETMRVSGDPTEASQWYERSHEIFEKIHDHVGNAFYHRGMGDIAFARQDYPSAREYFTRSVELARNAKYTWMVAYSLTGRGMSELNSGDLDSASTDIHEALRLAAKTGDKGITLFVLCALSELLFRQGKAERAIELTSLVNEHISSWHATKKQASNLLARLGRFVPKDQFKKTRIKGLSLVDLWETVEKLIASTSRKM